MGQFLKSFAFVAALLTPSAAFAAGPLWYTAEDTGLTFTGTVTSGNGAGTYDSLYSRAAIAVGNNTTVASPPANMFSNGFPFKASCTNCWYHAVFYAAGNTTTLNQQSMLVYSGSKPKIVVRQTGSAGTLKVSTETDAGVLTDLATASGTFAATTLTHVDLQVIWTCSGAGGVNMWLNSVQVIAFSGNPCTDSETSLNGIAYSGVATGTGTGCGGGGVTCWSQFLATDSEDTRSEVVYTLTTGTSGATQNCTPNTPANVNKASISDTSFVSTSTNNTICEFGGATSAPAGAWAVRSVSMEERLLISTTGPQNAEFIAHVSGSDYTGISGCSNPTLTNSFANYRCQMDMSPATGLVWGINEVFNSGANLYSFGFESLM